MWVRSPKVLRHRPERTPEGPAVTRKQEPSKPGWRIAKVLPWTTTDSLNALTSVLSSGP